MTTIAHTLPSREACHGVRQILRFNWPFYAIGIPVALIAPLAIGVISVPSPIHILLYSGTALVWLWLVGSIVASWLVYDRSELMTGSWVLPALGRAPRAWVAVHAGLDEMTPALESVLASRGRTLDIFDPREMTDSSIARARTAPGGHSERVDFRRLPIADASVDAVFLMLSAHELRTHPTRAALFSEIRRGLARGGRVVVAEHLRNFANFAAYGPGALHFHSRRSWLRTFGAAGLAVSHERSITPFVHVFILRRAS